MLCGNLPGVAVSQWIAEPDSSGRPAAFHWHSANHPTGKSLRMVIHVDIHNDLQIVEKAMVEAANSFLMPYGVPPPSRRRWGMHGRIDRVTVSAIRPSQQPDAIPTQGRISQPLKRKENAMSGINKVILLGHLGWDPEIRYMPDGTANATLNVTTSETYKDRDGNKQERTEWHLAVFWGRTASC